MQLTEEISKKFIIVWNIEKLVINFMENKINMIKKIS